MNLPYIQIFLAAIMVIGSVMPTHAASKLVAAVMTSDLPRYRDAHRSFVKTLAQKGYDQSNIEIIMQSPNPDPISWANTIRKFNAIRADIIITYGAPITLAALREADDIPVVFADVYGPVETGISRSMSGTGKNITGVSSKVPMAHLIKTATGIKPIKTMGVIYNSREVGSLVQLKEIKRLAALHGFAVLESNIASLAALDTVLNALTPRVDIIYVSECAAGSRGFEKIVHRANEAKVPVISHMPDASDKGALLALEINPAEQGQMAAEYAARILGGKKANQMAINTPKKIELVLNMRAAKTLNLHVPFQVLSLATRILK